jgi:hypothetical protein
MPYTFRSLCHASRAELEAAMKAGVRPALDDLAGWEFRGFNTPLITKVLGIRKFKKGFYRTASTPPGRLEGYNVRTRQNGFEGPWVDVVRKGEPLRHGFFAVVEPSGADRLYPNAVLIDYSQGKNPAYDPTRLLRDYLVQVDPDNRELFLGKAYLALGPKRVFVSTFVLERFGPSPLGERQAA